MSVPATGQVDPLALASAIQAATGVPGVLEISGDTTKAGAVLSSEQWSDAQITQALQTYAYAAPVHDQLVANIETHLAQLEAWLTANPNGAALTAAQTAALARMLVGVGRLLLGLTSTVGQAT